MDDVIQSTKRINNASINATINPTYVFFASHCNESYCQSCTSSEADEETKNKRSSSYVYELDSSDDRFENKGSLFETFKLNSMPNLNSFDSKETTSLFKNIPRCLSAMPDFFHGPFTDDIDTNLIDFSNHVKNNLPCTQKKHLVDETVEILPQTLTCANIVANSAVDKAFRDISSQISISKPFNHFNNMQSIISASTQASPFDIEVETLVMPMINNFSQTELRIPFKSISVEKFRALKRIAAQNELTILSIRKDNIKYTVLRKKNALIQKQEAQRAVEAELQRQKPIEVKEKIVDFQCIHAESMQTDPCAFESTSIKTHNTTAQTNGRQNKVKPRIEEVLMNSAARRKAKRAAEQREAKKAAEVLREKKQRKREIAVQTCPPKWFICPLCRKDIPPPEQCGHIDLCRANFRQQTQELKAKAQLQNYRIAAENTRRRKHNLPLLSLCQDAESGQAQEQKRKSSDNNSGGNNIRSRTKSVDSNLAAALKKQAVIAAQLKQIHPNDVNTMLHVTQRVCSLPNCAKIVSSSAGSVCAHCRSTHCMLHRLPRIGHYCPTAPNPQTEKMISKAEVDASCGVEVEEHQTLLKHRIRARLNVMAERRRR